MSKSSFVYIVRIRINIIIFAKKMSSTQSRLLYNNNRKNEIILIETTIEFVKVIFSIVYIRKYLVENTLSRKLLKEK